MLETKGDFLDGTEDVVYKRSLLDYLTTHFNWDSAPKAGELELEQSGVTMTCKLVLFDDLPGGLDEMF